MLIFSFGHFGGYDISRIIFTYRKKEK